MNFKRLTENAKLPTIHNDYSPALALYTQDAFTLPIGVTTVVPVGIALKLSLEDTDRLCKVAAFMVDVPFWLRQYGLTSFGTTVFSLDYDGEWNIVLSNQGKQNVTFKKHDIIGMAIWFEHGLSDPMFDHLRTKEIPSQENGTRDDIRSQGHV